MGERHHTPKKPPWVSVTQMLEQVIVIVGDLVTKTDVVLDKLELQETHVMATIDQILQDMAAVQQSSQQTSTQMAQLVMDAQAIDAKMDTILQEIADLKAGGGGATQE